MSLAGCPHGPAYVTGGPGKCAECAAMREATRLATKHAKLLADPLRKAIEISEKRTYAEGYAAGLDAATALTAKFIDLCRESGSKGVTDVLYHDLLLPQMALKEPK